MALFYKICEHWEIARLCTEQTYVLPSKLLYHQSDPGLPSMLIQHMSMLTCLGKDTIRYNPPTR